jgi:hypothetical protein
MTYRRYARDFGEYGENTRMRAHLTDVAVRALKQSVGKQVKVWDTTTPGFGLIVGERSKSWFVVYGR